MSSFNSPRRDEHAIINIDDVKVAKSVIRALRSSSNSTRHYKQNASHDDHIIHNISQFNQMVINKNEEIQKKNLIEQQMNEAFSNYIPPKTIMTVINSPTEQKYREEMKEGDFTEDQNNNNISDDSDDEYIREKRSTFKNIPSPHTVLRTTKDQKDNDSDFEDEEDDPAEMLELMHNFVAPSMNHSTSSNSSTSNSKLLNKSNIYKGQSSYTSSSIKYGAAGIRGIQHQTLQKEHSNDELSVSSVIPTSTPYTSNHSKLMHIKPGQAIRVKAPNKKSRSNHINATPANT